ncbi:MAG: hypothetical protein VX311_15970 [Planctomycetota bacterium]|nr:hypothetical protein [Planctomycetota bacterium]
MYAILGGRAALQDKLPVAPDGMARELLEGTNSRSRTTASPRT